MKIIFIGIFILNIDAGVVTKNFNYVFQKILNFKYSKMKTKGVFVINRIFTVVHFASSKYKKLVTSLQARVT